MNTLNRAMNVKLPEGSYTESRGTVQRNGGNVPGSPVPRQSLAPGISYKTNNFLASSLNQAQTANRRLAQYGQFSASL